MMFEPMVSVILSISNDVKDVMMNKIIRHSVIQTPSCIYSFAAIKQEENFSGDWNNREPQFMLAGWAFALA